MQPQQYYPRQEHGGVYHHHHHHPGYPIHHARMQWSPGVPGPWAAYDIAYSSYPPVSGHISSSIASDQTAATPHNIRDILGGNQPGGTLPSEVAKTPSYQKSPSSAGAATGTVFHYPPPGVDLRSPTTPNHPDIPQGFYIPAIPGRPFVGFDPSALSPDGLSLHGIPYHGQTHLSDPQGMPRGDKGGIPGSKDNRKDRKGRATFSGNQIDELEKAFQATQYLTHAERTKLADRLSLGENQVKIWFQNRRTKCRRTAWKGSKTPSVSSPTTPTAPPTSLSTSTPVTPTQPTPPTSSVATTTQ